MTLLVIIGIVVALWLVGIVLVWSMLAIGRISDERRLPPIDDTYVVDGDEDWYRNAGTAKPGPGRLPGSPHGASSPGPGSTRDGHQVV